MKRKAVSGIVLAVFFTGLLITGFNIQTIGGAPVFYDDFNDGNDDGWTAFGAWSVVVWEYRALTWGDMSVVSTVDHLNLTQCSVETKLRFEESVLMPGFRAGIVFRLNNRSHHYSLEVSDQFDSVVFVYYSPANWEYGEVFASAAYPVSSNVDYTLKVVARGSTFKGYVNGVEVVSGADVNLKQGKVGLRARNAVVRFDNFAVNSLPARAITILSPQYMAYATTSIPLTFIVNESATWISYSLDGQANVTITGNTTLTSLLEGSYNVVVYANDTAGNMEASDTIYFTVDITPPTVSVLSPENTTYTSTSVPLTFTVNEPTMWIGYSLDGQANVTISGNTTLTVMTEGPHSVTLYANDTTGNTGASTVFFTVERLPCSVDIANAVTVFPGYRLFETTEAFPEWNLPINVTVNNEGTLPLTGTVSGYYSLDNATWLSLGSSQPISLSPSNGTLLVFYWNLRATGAGKSVYYMKFNATATSENSTDTDEFLVKIKVRLQGDVDGDNDCDVGDSRKRCLATFQSSPDPLYLVWNRYPLFTDMDGDGDVDVGDGRKVQLWMFKSWGDP